MRIAALLALAIVCGCSSDAPSCTTDLAPGGACPAACTSCDGNICHIQCGDTACADRTITCPADFACDVTCNGIDACDTSVIECPSRYGCTVTCTALDACGDVTLKCGSGSCGMTCNGPSESCVGSVIDCSSAHDCGATCNGAAGPTLDCGTACGCTPC